MKIIIKHLFILLFLGLIPYGCVNDLTSPREEHIDADGFILEDESGNEIGEHKGLAFYTLGQRQGLGIGGLKDSTNDPWYVAKKNLKNNTLVAVQGNNHPLLMSSQQETANLKLINELDEKRFNGKAKVRYRQEDQDCFIEILDKSLKVKFKKKQRAVTPGQSVVIYKDDVCLGGGEINSIN